MSSRKSLSILVTTFCLVLLALLSTPQTRSSAAQLPPILFVTQPPFGADFVSVNATFGNHRPRTAFTPRGGDLYIRYGDGTLRNLTAEAGFGLHAGKEIAVREPSVHWSGAKALFAMVIGGTTKNDYSDVFWQIYEITGLGKGETARIVKLPQAENYNNVSPLYGTDDRILFTSDRPHNGNPNLYPQLDEYESQPTNTGLWSMNADGSDVRLLDHAPSGAFTPIIASDGRVVYTRWDHLQRDQQNNDGAGGSGAYNFASEYSATKLTTNVEIFPESRTEPRGYGHTMNQFIPWQINEDGSGHETLGHIGRHELSRYFTSQRAGLPEFIPPSARRTAERVYQLKEDPLRPGYFYGTYAPEFYTHAAGQIIALNAAESVNPDDMQVAYITDPTTREVGTNATNPLGHFRNPVPLSDGSLIAVRTTVAEADSTTSGILSAKYDFHLALLQSNGTYFAPVEKLIPNGITKTISYWDNQPYTQISYSGRLWELDPVEVRARPRPNKHTDPLPAIETQILSEELGGTAGIAKFREFLQARKLALVVSRDVTRRGDKQQEYNLKVFGSAKQTSDGSTPTIELSHLQFFQGDLIRSYSNYGTNSNRGRRPLAQIMRDGLTATDAPPGSVKIASDGSVAALVPAQRALSWQMNKPDGTAALRERYWVTFAPGEMRSCTNCHGVNRTDVLLKQPPPTNPPQALRDLARWYRDNFAAVLATSVSGASFTNHDNAQESILSIFGTNLATTTQGAIGTTLPTIIAGTRVLVRDSLGVERAAPLFFVAPTQINYQIPPGTETGLATVNINNNGTITARGTLQVVAVAPGIFTAASNGKDFAAAEIARVKANGQQIVEPIARYDSAQARFVAVPIDFGADEIVLVLYATGVRFCSDLKNVSATVGGLPMTVEYAGKQNQFVGLDQINIRLSRSLIGRGDVDVRLMIEGRAANVVKINVK
ncbi:MAG TPA: hypothetical protein VFZ34_11440 [Blastocatellia bacterium]|nr:hypothetical protein [Blastocatellia bacterium]